MNPADTESTRLKLHLISDFNLETLGHYLANGGPGRSALRHRKMKGREGRAGVYSTKHRPRRTGAVAEGKLSPEALNRFIRLAVSPEPE